jgi:hypothetical protein
MIKEKSSSYATGLPAIANLSASDFVAWIN